MLPGQTHWGGAGVFKRPPLLHHPQELLEEGSKRQQADICQARVVGTSFKGAVMEGQDPHWVLRPTRLHSSSDVARRVLAAPTRQF